MARVLQGTTAIVLGGGISGLTAAYSLRNVVDTVVLVEQSSRYGGWLDTHYQDGHVFERGAHGFRPRGNGKRLLEMIYDLGLKDEMICTGDTSAGRFIWADGAMRRLPPRPAEALQSPLLRALAAGIVRDTVTPPRGDCDGDESVHEFFERRFGPAVANKVASAMVAGIFAGDSKTLSLDACFPLLREIDGKGGVLRYALHSAMQPKPAKQAGGHESEQPGDRGTFIAENSKAASVSFRGGMSELPRAIQSTLEGDDNVTLMSNTSVVGLRRGGHKPVAVTYESAGSTHTVEVDHVLCTLPAYTLPSILPSSCAAASAALSSIPFASVGVLNGATAPSDAITEPGFGYLVPTTEKTPLLGMTWDSQQFPAQAARDRPDSRFTIMAGGARFTSTSKEAMEEEMRSAVQLALKQHMGFQEDPVSELWGIEERCIPQYTLGHKRRVADARADLRESLPGVALLGASYDGVGVADCVANAMNAVEALVPE